MNKKPLFSVLIANYNNKAFLLDCVNSVRTQTYSNWEIILVDDCSTDNPHNFYEQLNQDYRIKIYFNDINRKTAFTFKRALDLSQGDICGFLGADDTLEETAIEKTIYKHLEFPNYSIVYTLNYICDKQLNILGLTKWGGRIPEGENQLTAPHGNKITSFVTFKKKHYYKTEGINHKFTRGFDQDFIYKMEEVGKVYCIEEPLYFYRMHSKNISLNENNVKAWYWAYIASKEAYNRRKKSKMSIKNLRYSELQRMYLKVCLLKIDEKLRVKNYRNILFYYYHALKLLIWDKDLLIFQAHIFFIKRWVLRRIRKNYIDFSLQYD